MWRCRRPGQPLEMDNLDLRFSAIKLEDADRTGALLVMEQRGAARIDIEDIVELLDDDLVLVPGDDDIRVDIIARRNLVPPPQRQAGRREQIIRTFVGEVDGFPLELQDMPLLDSLVLPRIIVIAQRCIDRSDSFQVVKHGMRINIAAVEDKIDTLENGEDFGRNYVGFPGDMGICDKSYTHNAL